jgi:hypothetical protein
MLSFVATSSVVDELQAAGLNLLNHTSIACRDIKTSLRMKAGERILAHGRPAVIVKVNPNTLSVKFDLEWMNALNITKVPYNALSQKCKEWLEMGLELGGMGLWI